MHPRGGITDELANLLGGTGRALREAAHFACHHSKPAPLLARTGRLHRSIERQNVGLEGNAVDQLRDFANAHRRRLDLLHGLGHAVHRAAAALAHRRGLAGQLHRLAGRFRGQLDGAGDLLHRCGGFLQVGRLRLGAGRQVAVVLGNLDGSHLHLVTLVARIAHDRLQVHAELGQGFFQVADNAAVLDVHALRQVARGQPVSLPHQLQQGHHRHAVGKARHGAGEHQRHAPGNGSAHVHGLPADQCSPKRQDQYGQCSKHQAAQHARHQQRTTAPPGIHAHRAARTQHVYLAARCLFGAQGLVKALGILNLLARGLCAHGHVARGLIPIHEGRDIRHHPVEVSVLAPVLDRSRPGLAAGDGLPHVAVGLFGHVGMAHDVVRLAQQLLALVAADFDEAGVAVEDAPLQVGGGNQGLPPGKRVLLRADGQIRSHEALLFRKCRVSITPGCRRRQEMRQHYVAMP